MEREEAALFFGMSTIAAVEVSALFPSLGFEGAKARAAIDLLRCEERAAAAREDGIIIIAGLAAAGERRGREERARGERDERRRARVSGGKK